MIEKVGEIEKRGVEQTEEVNLSNFVWEFSELNNHPDVKRKLADVIIASTYSPSGESDADFSKETRDVIAALSEKPDQKKGPTLAGAIKSGEFARHIGSPLSEPIQENVIQPWKAKKISEKKEEILKELKDAESIKDNVLREKRLAAVTKKQKTVEQKLESRWENLRATAEKTNTEKFGSSFEVRRSQAAVAAGKLAVRKSIVVPISEEAVPVSVAAAMADGATRDETAVVGKIVFERDLATNLTEADGQSEMADDLRIDNSAIESGTKSYESAKKDESPEATRAGALGEVALVDVVEAPVQKKRSRWNKFFTKEDGKLKKGVKLAAGALALVGAGVAVYAANHHGVDHQTVTAHVASKAQHVKNVFGLGVFEGSGHVAKETAQQVTNPGAVDHAVNTVSVGKPHAEAATQLVKGSHEGVRHFSLEKNGNLWNHVAETIRNHHRNWSEARVQAHTLADTRHILAVRGQDFNDARHFVAGTKF